MLGGKKLAVRLLGDENRGAPPVYFGERFGNERIEVSSRPTLDLGKRLLDTPCRAVRPLVSERIEEVRHCDDTRFLRNALAGDAIGIPRSVPPLMMTAGNPL